MIEITIPVLNEQATIEEKIKEIDEYLVKNYMSYDIDIVIADNGSTDQTEIISRRLCRELNRVRYIRTSEKGVGRALKKSWGESKAEIVGYMDLDLATDLSYLHPALMYLIKGKADVVTGSRLAKGSFVVGRKLIRKITSLGLNFIVKFVFSTKFSDGMCGFKFLQRETLENIVKHGAASNGWFFATELLIVAEYLGLRVVDLPIRWTDDANSKVKIIKLSLEYIKAIFILKKKLRDVGNI